jgi:hypothetical protein
MRSGVQMVRFLRVGDGGLYGHDPLDATVPPLHPARDFILGGEAVVASGSLGTLNSLSSNSRPSKSEVDQPSLSSAASIFSFSVARVSIPCSIPERTTIRGVCGLESRKDSQT